eukprot:CAMPEP_0177611956 /NCGR_PEP_ID=MMETSP0419_2-20121207/20883_1 /TAXON_ID=582737 /ORGANISM="Tetraselmis sp., Strain GSL018" /LENGTH=225 /DNA_ID=CAMNT_0019107951 /DNA_START=1075 /DNA_END=1749 /DNA_ORIENTATION=+
MLQLLEECAIFLPRPNLCFVQVTGEPISKAALRLRCSAAAPPSAPARRGGLPVPPPGVRPASPASQPPSECLSPPGRSPEASEAETEGAAPAAGAPPAQGKRLRRPSSWQRRRKRLRAEEAAAGALRQRASLPPPDRPDPVPTQSLHAEGKSGLWGKERGPPSSPPPFFRLVTHRHQTICPPLGHLPGTLTRLAPRPPPKTAAEAPVLPVWPARPPVIQRSAPLL